MYILSLRETCFTIPIAPVTKKNHGRIVMCGKYPKLLPSEAYERYEKAAMPFLNSVYGTSGTIDYPVNLKCFLSRQATQGRSCGVLAGCSRPARFRRNTRR